MYIVKTFKSGNSLAMSIPAEARRALEINRGDSLLIVITHGPVMVIKKITDEESKEIASKEIQYDE